MWDRIRVQDKDERVWMDAAGCSAREPRTTRGKPLVCHLDTVHCDMQKAGLSSGAMTSGITIDWRSAQGLTEVQIWFPPHLGYD